VKKNKKNVRLREPRHPSGQGRERGWRKRLFSMIWDDEQGEEKPPEHSDPANSPGKTSKRDWLRQS
jgi:hypothetical protein